MPDTRLTFPVSAEQAAGFERLLTGGREGNADALHAFLSAADEAALSDCIGFFLAAGEETRARLFDAANAMRERHYGKAVFFRGLIEFTSYCKNDCLYCGLRRSNDKAVRYRLTHDEILACCENGRRLGFSTFVLQGGEDAYYTDERMCAIVADIRASFPECAVTLSLGERGRESFAKLRAAGAERYLLRHETASPMLYAKLHPPELRLAHRIQCLWDLKELGYQVGAGFMVESPGQTVPDLAQDFLFLRALQPQMVGIGPFIPHAQTPFAQSPTPKAGSTLPLLALLRLLLPRVLLPATTALGTIDPLGREKGLRAGGNVVMPNLSPVAHRKDYSLYDNKICTGEEAAECLACLSRRIASAGFTPDFSRGDAAGFAPPPVTAAS